MARLCKLCSSALNGKFCSNCGCKVELERINGPYIRHEIKHFLYFEKGFFYTVRELLLRPGRNVRVYLTENRSQLVKPITFIIVASLIYTLANQLFHIEEQYVQFDEATTTSTAVILNWITSNYGYSNILMSIFIVFFVRLFFKKHNYNFYEILVLICYVMGIGMLILAVFAPLQRVFHFDIMQILTILFMVYTTFAIADFYDKRKPLGYFKSFSAYLLGMVVFYASAVMLGTLIDSIKN